MFQWLKFDIKRNCFRLNYCVGQTTRKTKCLVHVTHGMSLETYHEMFADVQRRVRIPYETLIKVSDLTAVHGN